MGAVVFFGPGAEVLSVEFASDYSAVQIHCFRPGRDTENIQMILNILGEFVPLSSRHIQPLFKVLPVVANVVTRDRHFAQREIEAGSVEGVVQEDHSYARLGGIWGQTHEELEFGIRRAWRNVRKTSSSNMAPISLYV